ncbi:MAG: PA2169 family four-helix-bundle protein [Pseudomonadota bacterium]
MAAEDKNFNLHSSTSEGSGAAAAVGSAQAAGNNSGDKGDIIDVLQDLAECSHDGEYGFRACAEQAERADLKSFFLQHADECRAAAAELNEQIRMLGGNTADHGTAAGALHRGWVAVKATLSTYDDKAVLEECERGQDNAKARYTNAMKKPLPESIKAIVARQLQGVQRNHDQIKQMRDQARAAS